MAISVSFNGATIYKPGSYSKTTIDLGGSFPLGVAGLVAILGEADAGTPGASESDIAQNFYTPDQMAAVRAKYRSGPIVDAMNFLFAPASDAAVPNGASTVWVYKTNASVRATKTLPSYGTVRAREWGVGGNRISIEIENIAETPATVTGTVDVLGADFALGETLDICVDGGAVVSHTIVTSTDPSDLLVQLNAAFGGLTFSIVSDKLKITRTVDASSNLIGYMRSFEIDAASTSLATFGLSATWAIPAVLPSCTITLDNKRDNIQETDSFGGNKVLQIGYTGAETTASVTIDDSKITLLAGATSIVIQKSAYTTVKQLVDEIALLADWTAFMEEELYYNLPLEVLDKVSGVGAISPSAENVVHIMKNAYEVREFFEASSMCELSGTLPTDGIPSAMTESLLSGGDSGATLSADIVTGLDKFTKFHVNSIVPLFSRSASADITDGLTHEDSTYTIGGINQAVKTHISLMKTTKKRSERQGYISMKDTYADTRVAAIGMNDARLQLAIQDVKQTDAAGVIKWFQPWALACMLAGARGGAPIGTPLTFKYLNVSGIRHTAQSMLTDEEDIVIDFDPDTQYEQAIQSGITFLEAPQTGGFRCVVDNTTYGVDDNWVFNRANVLYAADIVAFNLRNRLEQAFVGQKNNIKASTVASVASSVLNTFLAQGITVSTPDAPNGFKQLVARIDGNVISVNVVIKLVEGIDFALVDLLVQRAQQ